MGIGLLASIFFGILEIFPNFKECIFIKRPAAPLQGIFVHSWEHQPAPGCMDSHGYLLTTKTQPATENGSQIFDKTSTFFMPQPGMTSRRDDTNFSLKTEGNVTVYKAVQM